MANRAVAKLIWVGAVGASALILNAAQEARSELTRLVDQQSRINDSLIIHINAFQALEAGAEGWADEFQHVNRAKDMLGLYELFDISKFGLSTSLDNFRLVSSSPYQINGVDIGMINVCVDSGNSVLGVGAESYSTLLSGLNAMENSNEVSFDFVNIVGGDALPRAELGNVCIMLRADEVGSDTDHG